MKQQERIARERVFGTTPDIVARRLTYTLDHLEEEPQMKKRSIPVLVFVLLIVLAGAAYAAVTGGLKSYYETRFDHGGMLPKDVDQRIQSEIQQSDAGNPLVNVTVAGAAWLGKGLDIDNPDSETLDIDIHATAKDPSKYELVDGMAIDVDCARGEDERRENPKYGDRADEPWLWAYGTHGPIDKVMKDPTKQLLLFGGLFEEEDIWIEGAKDVKLPIPSYDPHIDKETGDAVAVYVYRFTAAELATLRTHADTDGYVTLVYRSWAEPFVDGEQGQHGVTGTTTFKIKLP